MDLKIPGSNHAIEPLSQPAFEDGARVRNKQQEPSRIGYHPRCDKEYASDKDQHRVHHFLGRDNARGEILRNLLDRSDSFHPG
jgi:hypothetical protein